jgi:hypothetical protein
MLPENKNKYNSKASATKSHSIKLVIEKLEIQLSLT